MIRKGDMFIINTPKITRTRKNKKKITMTITDDSLTEMLNTYTKEHNTKFATAVQEILKTYFKHNRIIRGQIELKQEINLLIPLKPTLIHDFIEKEINILTTTEEIIDNITILNEVDKNKIIEDLNVNSEETLFKIVSYDIINNYLDTYDEERKSYYHQELNTHRGLKVVSVNDVGDEKELIVFVETISKYDKLVSAKIITREQALKYACECNNPDLVLSIDDEEKYYDVSGIANSYQREQELKSMLENAYMDIDLLNEELERLKRGK